MTTPSKPRVLIGSTKSSKELADDVQAVLGQPYYSTCWYQTAHKSDLSKLEKVNDLLKDHDFGIYVFSVEDMQSNEKAATSEQLQAIAEVALFITALGKENTSVIVPEGREAELPFSFLGLNP